MKLSQLFPAAFLLLLVSVIAGNDVTTFNQEEIDEDNVDTILESEHFFQVVDRRSSTPPRNIAAKTSAYQNSSPVFYSETFQTHAPEEGLQHSQAPFKTSLSNSPPPSYYDVINQLPPGNEPHYDGGSNITSPTSRISMIDGWTPLPKWENLEKEYQGDEYEDDLFGEENEFLPLNGDHSQGGHSRYRRALKEGSGYLVDEVQFEIKGQKKPTMDDATKAMNKHFKKKLPNSDVEAEVTKIEERPKKRQRRQTEMTIQVTADVRYDNDFFNRSDIASVLNELTDDNAELTIGNISYIISNLMIGETGKDLVAIICFLCKGYQDCVLGNLTNSWSCRLSDPNFYPFGKELGDIPFPRDIEHATVALKPKYPIPFGDDLVTSFMVSANGLVSASEAFTSFSPVSCTLLNRNRKGRVMAPYWTDLDVITNDPGQVWSRVILNLQTTSAEDKVLLQRANSDVTRYAYEKDYNTIVLIIVTWSDLAPYPVEINKDQRVTFQLLIMSNLVTTYAMYNYAAKAMNLDPISNRMVEVCYKDRSLELNMHRYYRFDEITGNTNIPGRWIYNIGQVQDSRTKCYRWFMSNMQMYSLIDFWSHVVEQCPCSEFQARISFRWIQSYLEPGCYDSFPIYGTYGRRCCYRGDFSRSFETRQPKAGSFQLFTPYHGDLNRHETYDAIPKRWCCRESNLCNFYYMVRPVSTCRPSFIFRSFFFGDPHILTLDGQSYTFNGLGEFTLLEINGSINTSFVDFGLQGRTCRARTENGTISDATVFCALGLRNTNGTLVFMQVPKNGSDLILYINKEDLTQRYRDTPHFNMSLGGLHLQKDNNALKVTTQDEIVVTINFQAAYRLLDFTVGIDAKYKRMTSGLMGNFNGDSSDDYIFPNKTILPNTTSDRGLFELGNSWKVTNSFLRYGPGENNSTFCNSSFVPIFLDEFTATERESAAKRCGGEKNVACIYDLLATKNEAFASNTQDSESTYIKDSNTIANQPPVINGPVLLNVIVGQTTSIMINGSDPDNDNITFLVLQQPSSGFVWSENNGTFQANYTPADLIPASIEVAVNDSKGLRSSSINIALVVCNGCNNNGSCNFAEINTTSDQYFSIATCDCRPEYSGGSCENDKNGCEDDVCPPNITCIDVTAAVEMATKKAFSCGACPSGYLLNVNSSKCEDINECTTVSSACPPYSNCINLIGSHKCECTAGFRHSRDNTCSDIDECAEKLDLCNHFCNNTQGSYYCTCRDGYKLESINKKICNATTDPCKDSGIKCHYQCVNMSGKAECICNKYSKLNPDGVSCDDINECLENVCSQTCNNIENGYECGCRPGYYLTDKTACEICPSGQYGIDCKYTCNCKGNAVGCDNIRGCICNSFWKGPFCDEDVDECNVTENPCSKEKLCVNTVGGYTCNCPEGYDDVSQNGSCININECVNPELNNCSYGCNDSVGSFTCLCGEGRVLINDKCTDIDECSLGTAKCKDDCVNVDGSYSCDCPVGYALDYDRKGCIIDRETIPNDCLAANCAHSCEIEEGLPKCKCYRGYVLGSDKKSCNDFNECVTKNNCTDICDNTDGSYTCSCHDGKQLMNDGRSCIGCDGFHWGPNCNNECACNPIGFSRCDPVNGCVCKAGWMGPTCSTNIDECNQNENVCPAFSTCIDTPGSFICQCIRGFLKDSNNNCTDINECSQSPCDHMCNNTIGSYFCTCHSGFTLNGNKCTDIDECSKRELNNCDQKCRNTVGRYACECYQGYSLNMTTRNTCYSTSPQTCNCSGGHCTTNNGQSVCSCPQGYKLGPTNDACENINECLPSTNPCGLSATCNDTDGSFDCLCGNGTKLATDGLNCIACNHLSYGPGCSETCKCNTTTTKICSAVNGACECNRGWTGPTCSDDDDECKNPTMYKCGANATCQNVPGSYKCACADAGFVSTGNGACSQCDATHYGPNCLKNCNCIQANTASCDPRNGACTCKPHFTGALCEGCAENYYGQSCISCRCNMTNTASCNRSNGACTCKTGWAGPLCNECADNHYGPNCVSCSCSMINTERCDPSNGTCTCKAGWTGPTCDGCDVKHYGSGCLECCNLTNTERCDNNTGACICKSGWTGASCDQFIDTSSSADANTNLIIGLAAGIPLFIIAIIVVALIAVFYVRRSRMRDQESSSQSVDNAAPFRSQFPTRVSTKGSWGAPLARYAPDAYSEIGSMDSGNGGLAGARPKGRPDFQDSPWYDNKAGPSAPTESRGAESTAPTSNFSWEYMFRLLEPHKDFEIQRPRIAATPNPTFTGASNGSDSAA